MLPDVLGAKPVCLSGDELYQVPKVWRLSQSVNDCRDEKGRRRRLYSPLRGPRIGKQVNIGATCGVKVGCWHSCDIRRVIFNKIPGRFNQPLDPFRTL